VYLKEYYELHGVFELIDAGSVQRICSTTHGQQGNLFGRACRSLAYVGLEGCMLLPPLRVTLIRVCRHDHRIDLSELKAAVPLLVGASVHPHM